MQLKELVLYAQEKYRIEEQHKWTDFPGFSVLSHPQTGKWIALLMRQWDSDSGTEIERCDLKCGSDSLLLPPPYLSPPIRMRGRAWVGIAFDERTDSDVVFRLFDRAISAGNTHGYTIVLASQLPSAENSYQETALPFAGSAGLPEREEVPERLLQMRRLYEYGRDSTRARAKNFYRQAVFMADYEDSAPWTGSFTSYFPTYHDLNTRQLRGYFTWRAKLRRGEVQPIPASAAYLYVYELLNGVGAASAEESLEKLRTFESAFVDSGLGDARMRTNLRRWMLEFAVLRDLPPALARQCADPELMERDSALAALRTPDAYSDRQIFAALCTLGGKKIEDSPVLADDPERGKRLFAEAWRSACAYRRQDRDLFTLCFGERRCRSWYPLSNAVYYEQSRPADRDYLLDPCRAYHCRGGIWQEEAYEKPSFDRTRLQGFLHEADALLRRSLKTGRYLRENPADAWAAPYIEAVIAAERKAALEAARPKITIDLGGLEQIRRDAAATRESLLTEQEIEEAEETALPAPAGTQSGLPLNDVQIRILRALLEGRDTKEIIREQHLMPSVTADAVNEALFDEFGDTVILCEDDRLLLVDDYTEDLERYLGGTAHGGT